MDIQTRKISFVKEFLNIEDEDLIQSFEDLLRLKKTEEDRQNLKPMSMDQFNQEISKSMEDSVKGRIIKASELK